MLLRLYLFRFTPTMIPIAFSDTQPENGVGFPALLRVVWRSWLKRMWAPILVTLFHPKGDIMFQLSSPCCMSPPPCCHKLARRLTHDTCLFLPCQSIPSWMVIVLLRLYLFLYYIVFPLGGCTSLECYWGYTSFGLQAHLCVCCVCAENSFVHMRVAPEALGWALAPIPFLVMSYVLESWAWSIRHQTVDSDMELEGWFLNHQTCIKIQTSCIMALGDMGRWCMTLHDAVDVAKGIVFFAIWISSPLHIISAEWCAHAHRFSRCVRGQI